MLRPLGRALHPGGTMTSPAEDRPGLTCAGARVGVWGLGVEGLANLRKLHALGVAPVLVDDQPRLGRRCPVLATGRRRPGRAGALRRGGQDAGHQPVPARGGPARAGGRPGGRRAGPVARRKRPRRVVCVTGTKGKSTTAAIAGHLLTRLGYRCLVGGQHRRAALGPGRARPGLRLLGHRDVQLPGHRPALLAAGGRGHLAAPRSPALARREWSSTTGTSCPCAPSRAPT